MNIFDSPSARCDRSASEWGADKMAEWVKREHGKGAINRAGKILLEWWISPDDMELEPWSAAYRVVKNWRLCHALPLNVIQAGLRGRIRRMGLGEDVIVAQRLKRFPSIMNKLERESNMELTQMQDLGVYCSPVI